MSDDNQNRVTERPDSLKTSLFAYSYPEELVGVEHRPDYRTMLSNPSGPREISSKEIFALFEAGDVLVVNDTQVVKRRVFSEEGFEVLFLEDLGDKKWQVLFPASRLKRNQCLHLPDGVELKLFQKGLPQIVALSRSIGDKYFEQFGEMALPPYIQKARGERHNNSFDNNWYQTAWAEKAGSCAAPTASLHFTNEDIETLKAKGVQVLKVTLHVGLGTFLPVKAENLLEHKMHSEWAHIPGDVIEAIQVAKQNGNRVFALGTTVTRTLESWPKGLLSQQQDGSFSGGTDLFIYPGFEFKVVDVLMTNFHQPESTLLALVAGFAGYERVMADYKWAIENKFRLFSYGDFSVWQK